MRWSLAALVAVVCLGSGCTGPDSAAAPAAGTSTPLAAVSSPLAAVSPHLAATSSVPSPAKDPNHISLAAMRPSAAKAAANTSVVYRNGCHVLPKPATRAHLCVYGDRSAKRTVVLFGDSHMAQWFPAFDAAAKSEHLKLLYITKSACPAASVSVRTGSVLYRACDTWRDNAISLIKSRGHVDLIVLGGSAGTAVTKRHTSQLIKNATARAKEWRLGVRRTVLALRGTAGEVLIMRDTPRMQVVASACLRSNGGDNRGCQTAYATATATPFGRAERIVARGYSNVGTADFTSGFCSPVRCRPVTSTDVLRWRDHTHMTATFSKLLAPLVRTALERALAGHLTN